MCGGGVRSMLLLPLVARCLETIDVCICSMLVFISPLFHNQIVRKQQPVLCGIRIIIVFT